MPKFFSRRRLFLALLVLGLGYGAAIPLFSHHDDDVAEASGASAPAPEVVMSRLDGKTAKLSDYRGKWVLLNFWATWCPPCVAEMPSMEEFSHAFKGKNMVVLAVSVDRGGPGKVQAFVKERGITFDVFHDAEGDVSGKFGVYSLPSTFIINPKGEIVSQAMGGREWNDPVIIDYFNGLMKRKQ